MFPWLPAGALSTEAYLGKHLRPGDLPLYAAAGLLPYRKKAKGDDAGIELLLAHEKPWNPMTKAYDPLALNVVGGKRVSRQESSVETTAVRCFLEIVGPVDGAPDAGELYGMMQGSFALWYPTGKFALLIVEVSSEAMADLPKRFQAARDEAGPLEETRTLPMGIKKYVKQIEKMEWVSTDKLIPETKSDVCNMLENLLKISGFRDFLSGTLDPATFPEAPQDEGVPPAAWSPPPPAEKGGKGGYDGRKGGYDASDGGKGGGKPKGKGKDRGKGGKAKGQKGWKGSGKGMGIYTSKGGGKPGPWPAPVQGGVPMPVPMMYNSPEIQWQMCGEQLYMLLQPMVPSPYLAQKITGMLLELPQNELMLNMTNPEELKRRVNEAMEVLKEDGIVE